MKALNLAKSPYTSLAINFAYALGNCMVGFLTHSWWFITVGAYYMVLTVTRFSVLQIRRKAGGNYDTELFARRITGILLIVLSLCIVYTETHASAKEILRKVFSTGDGVCFALTIPTMAMVIFAKV